MLCVVWVELPELVSVPLPEGRPVGWSEGRPVGCPDQLPVDEGSERVPGPNVPWPTLETVPR